jgi:ribonuclease P protein component
MNKKYIIRKNEEIQDIINNSSKKINNYFVVYYKKNYFDYNRYCISISKKIGKANVRNLYKRRIKDIIMKNKIDNSYDCVIILRKAILDISFIDIKNELVNILEDIK